MLVPPDCPWEHLSEVITKCLDNILPVIIYVVSDETLSDAVSIYIVNPRMQKTKKM